MTHLSHDTIEAILAQLVSRGDYNPAELTIEYKQALAALSAMVEAVATEENTNKTYKLLWKMYEELLEERSNSSARDSSGTIISLYARKITSASNDAACQRAIALGFQLPNKEDK